MNVAVITAYDSEENPIVPIGISLTMEGAELNAEWMRNNFALRELAASIRVVPAVLIFDESSFDG